MLHHRDRDALESKDGQCESGKAAPLGTPNPTWQEGCDAESGHFQDDQEQGCCTNDALPCAAGLHQARALIEERQGDGAGPDSQTSANGRQNHEYPPTRSIAGKFGLVAHDGVAQSKVAVATQARSAVRATGPRRPRIAGIT